MSDVTTNQAQDLLFDYLDGGGTTNSVLAVLSVDHPDILAAAVRRASEIEASRQRKAGAE